MPNSDLQLSSYHYHLPPQCIAQHPADQRDQSRLMVIHPDRTRVEHRTFADIVDLIGPEDMVVVNDTRVFPARLLGKKTSGGKIELFLLEYPRNRSESEGNSAIATGLVKASKRPKPGATLSFGDLLQVTFLEELGEGKARLRLQWPAGTELLDILQHEGQVPLPPYIGRAEGSTEIDRNRYQTVYAGQPGAVAAPTAGLHFTQELLERLTAQGTQLERVTLHVGYGTFAPVRSENIEDHQIHHEYLEISATTAANINEVKARGGKIWAVGTTTVRALEYGAAHNGTLQAFQGWCDLYIYPGFTFRVIDHLITNFHLPDSSLMFLVAALCGRENLLSYYQMAIENGYRFFSYGDAMVILAAHGK